MANRLYEEMLNVTDNQENANQSYEISLHNCQMATIHFKSFVKNIEKLEPL